MTINLTWAALAVVVSVIGHALFTIWSAATFKTTIIVKIDNIVNAMQRLDRELEKRDNQISAAWRKIDGLNDRLTRIETKCDSNHDKED